MINLANRNMQKLVTAAKKGFKAPFPIQEQTIPCIMSGRDVIGIAETGSGKTLAYLLPMIRHIMDQRPIKDGEGPVGIIMAPTRELAGQIFAVFSLLSEHHPSLKCGLLVGGSPVKENIEDFEKNGESSRYLSRSIQE